MKQMPYYHYNLSCTKEKKKKEVEMTNCMYVISIKGRTNKCVTLENKTKYTP